MEVSAALAAGVDTLEGRLQGTEGSGDAAAGADPGAGASPSGTSSGTVSCSHDSMGDTAGGGDGGPSAGDDCDADPTSAPAPADSVEPKASPPGGAVSLTPVQGRESSSGPPGAAGSGPFRRRRLIQADMASGGAGTQQQPQHIQYRHTLNRGMIARGELTMLLSNMPRWQALLSGMVPLNDGQLALQLLTDGMVYTGAWLLRRQNQRGPDMPPSWRLCGLQGWMQQHSVRDGDRLELRAAPDGRLFLTVHSRAADTGSAGAGAAAAAAGTGAGSGAQAQGPPAGNGGGDGPSAAGQGAPRDEDDEAAAAAAAGGGQEDRDEAEGTAAAAAGTSNPSRSGSVSAPAGPATAAASASAAAQKPPQAPAPGRQRAPRPRCLPDASESATTGMFVRVDAKPFSQGLLRLPAHVVRTFFASLPAVAEVAEGAEGVDSEVRLVDEATGETHTVLLRTYGKANHRQRVLKRMRALYARHSVQPEQRVRLRRAEGQADNEAYVWVEPAQAGAAAAAAPVGTCSAADSGSGAAAAAAPAQRVAVEPVAPAVEAEMPTPMAASALVAALVPAAPLTAQVLGPAGVLAVAPDPAQVPAQASAAVPGAAARQEDEADPDRPAKRRCTEIARSGSVVGEQRLRSLSELPPGPAPSIAHLHGCVPPGCRDGGEGGGGLPPLRPGELRLCGLTFHPDVAAAARRQMDEWLAALGDSLANADPAGVQVSMARVRAPAAGTADGSSGAAAAAALPGSDWRSAFEEHGLSANVVCARLARLLGLLSPDKDWDTPLPEDGWGLVEGVTPVGDPQRGGAGLAAAVPLRRNAVIGVVGGYVMPAATAAQFVGRGFRECAGGVVSELAARAAPAGELTQAWQFVAGSFRLAYPGLELAAEGAAGPVSLELNMLGYGNLTALVNDPRVDPRAWVPGNDVDSPPAANCLVVPVSVRGLVLPVLVALRDIAPGEQLLRDYGAEWWRRVARPWENLDFDGLQPEQLLHPVTLDDQPQPQPQPPPAPHGAKIEEGRPASCQRPPHQQQQQPQALQPASAAGAAPASVLVLVPVFGGGAAPGFDAAGGGGRGGGGGTAGPGAPAGVTPGGSVGHGGAVAGQGRLWPKASGDLCSRVSSEDRSAAGGGSAGAGAGHCAALS